MKKINFVSVLTSLALVLVAGSVVLAGSWSEPTAPAPNGNAEAPLNVSDVAQIKNGSLGIGGNFSAAGDGIFGYLAGQRGGIFLAPPIAYGKPAIQAVTPSWNAETLMLNPVGGAVNVMGLLSAFDRLSVVSGGGAYSLPTNLNIGTPGATGASAFCDENGQNCFTAAQVVARLGGSVTPPPTGGDTTKPPAPVAVTFDHQTTWIDPQAAEHTPADLDGINCGPAAGGAVVTGLSTRSHPNFLLALLGRGQWRLDCGKLNDGALPVKRSWGGAISWSTAGPFNCPANNPILTGVDQPSGGGGLMLLCGNSPSANLIVTPLPAGDTTGLPTESVIDGAHPVCPPNSVATGVTISNNNFSFHCATLSIPRP